MSFEHHTLSIIYNVHNQYISSPPVLLKQRHLQYQLLIIKRLLKLTN